MEKPRVSLGDLSGISCHQLEGVFLLWRETDSITRQPRIYGAAAAEGSARLLLGSRLELSCLLKRVWNQFHGFRAK